MKYASEDDVGSGTIIDSRIGSTTILTCGHIFRNWDKQCVIEVESFSAGKIQTFVGKRIYHNLEDDVGLISLNADLLPACRVAPPGTKIVIGTPVVSVGCSQGDKPTEQALKITALNRYLGADNIECSGVPKEGRSGGGLFTRDGQLIGVCNAAAPHNKEGLYAGLKTVQALLERCKMAHLYRPAAGSESPRYTDRSGAGSDVESAGTDFDAVPVAAAAPQTPKIVKTSATKSEPRRRNVVAEAAETPEADDLAIREALEQAGEAEIVCIIRPIHQPRAASRVLILNRASRKFVEYLSDEMESQQEITETTLKSKGQELRRRPVARHGPRARKSPRRPVPKPRGQNRMPTRCRMVRGLTEESRRCRRSPARRNLRKSSELLSRRGLSFVSIRRAPPCGGSRSRPGRLKGALRMSYGWRFFLVAGVSLILARRSASPSRPKIRSAHVG